MKFVVALALLLVAVAQAAHHDSMTRKLTPVYPTMPVNPKHTAQEWEEIFKKATQKIPENVPNFKKGTQHQDERAGKTSGKVPAITNGQSAQEGQFPWQVQIIMDQSYFCGGSIIGNNWILTAGHCCYQFSSWQVTYDTIVLDQGQSETTGASTLHESYDPNRIDNDICVLRLGGGISYNEHTGPVKLPTGDIQTDGQSMRVSGYGKTDDFGGLSQSLNFVDLTGITNDECAQTYGDIIIDSKLCVATPNGQSTCNGDSGGPLCIQQGGSWVEVGIVSFGSSAGCTQGYPAAFTRVTSFRQWIESNSGIILT